MDQASTESSSWIPVETVLDRSTNHAIKPLGDIISHVFRVASPCCQGPVIIYVAVGGGGGRGAVKAISDWLEGGASLFYKEVQWGQQFDREVYFKMGALAKMDIEVKQQSTNNIRETVILNCTNFC